VSGCSAYLEKNDGFESGPSSQIYKRRFRDTSLRRTTVIALRINRSRSSGELKVRSQDRIDNTVVAISADQVERYSKATQGSLVEPRHLNQ
jgi:hypothetical protein